MFSARGDPLWREPLRLPFTTVLLQVNHLLPGHEAPSPAYSPTGSITHFDFEDVLDEVAEARQAVKLHGCVE